MMVTADEYELPLCVEDTAENLGLRIGISKKAVFNKKYNDKRCLKVGAKPRKMKYRIYAVEEIEDELEE